MTNDKFKPTFKQPFIPQTETRIFLGGRPIDQQTEQTGSKGINKQHYQSERANEINPGYGPCSYSGCSYPNVPFSIDISIEGKSRNWAVYNDMFPGIWSHSSHMLYDYYWRENLYLNQIDQARDAINSMGNNHLWVVNAAGLFCVENGKFCNNAKDILNKCISHHERGNKVDESEVISSDLHKYAKWTVKTAAIAAVTAINPIGTAAVGGTIWGAGKAMEHHPDANEYDKKIFRSISSFGGDAAKSGIAGEIFGKLTNAWSPDVKGVYNTYEKVNTGKDLFLDFTYHKSHTGRGLNYDSDCEICKKS